MKKSIEKIGSTAKTHRTLVLTAAGLVLTVITLVAALLAWPTLNARTFSGVIQDSTCAATAVNLENECSVACVRKGAKWVLFDPFKEKIYELDDQETSEKFAVQHVAVVGKLDKTTKTIHVVKIKGL
jgi:ATP/ADP translocase